LVSIFDIPSFGQEILGYQEKKLSVLEGTPHLFFVSIAVTPPFYTSPGVPAMPKWESDPPLDDTGRTPSTLMVIHIPAKIAVKSFGQDVAHMGCVDGAVMRMTVET
jgi:hypothetical protein